MINALKTDVYQERQSAVKFYNAKPTAPFDSQPAHRRAETVKPVFHVRRQLLNHILAQQSSHDFNSLLPHLEPINLQRDENLYKPGETARYAYFLEDAVVSHLHVLADGSTIEVAMIGGEGVAGLASVFGALYRTFWTEVTAEGTALRINVEVLKQEFKQIPALRDALLKYTNQYIEQVSQRVVCNAHHTVEERFCNWLLMLHDRVKKSRLSLTQDQIARYLGVHRPSVTHIAQSLRERGAINYVRGYVEILDRELLEKLACECYQTIAENNRGNSAFAAVTNEAFLIV